MRGSREALGCISKRGTVRAAEKPYGVAESDAKVLPEVNETPESQRTNPTEWELHEG